MKYFDCFTFFNELDLLKLRCEELKELSPVHVLVEARHTHTGDPKPLYFDENKWQFNDYNIRHIIVDELPNTGDAWVNENYQRDCIMWGLYADCEDDDVVGIFDLDEIPKAEMVKQYKAEMGIVGVKMDKFSYYLNCVEGYQQWEVGRLLTYGMLKQSTPNKIRNSGFDTVMCNAGWHFAWVGGIDKMFQKLDAFAHQEANTAELRNSLERKFETGQSLWHTDYWRFVGIDVSFPKYLRENISEFEHLIKKI